MAGPQEKVWIQTADSVWELALVLKRNDSEASLQVQLLSSDSLRTISQVDAVLFDQTHSQQLDDLCEMNNLHEAPLLHTLAERLRSDKMYTAVSNIMM